MITYTVIGHYETTGQAFAEHVTAPNPYEAMKIIANDTLNAPHDLLIVGVIEGAHQLTVACEQTGNAVFAIDLR